MKKPRELFLVVLACSCIHYVYSQTIPAVDTTNRPPQVVTTFPSSVSDEVLFGNDSLTSSISDIEINFGAASAKTQEEVEAVSNAMLLVELKALRQEVAALREEVKGLRRKKRRHR